jgi:starvation-inducible DNA-binding protein
MSTRERVLRAAKIGAGLTLGALVAATVWTRYQRAKTETMPYTVVAKLGDVELRRYPRTVAVETVAPSENKAFSRLFRYIAGANDGSSEVSMTAPVEVDARSASIEMTTPVEVDLGSRLPGTETEAGDEGERDADDGVRMAFYLPAAYDPDSAPTPTDDRRQSRLPRLRRAVDGALESAERGRRRGRDRLNPEGRPYVSGGVHNETRRPPSVGHGTRDVRRRPVPDGERPRYETREAVVHSLNQALADTTDLQTQTKHAHWNVKGMQFQQLHELFDEQAELLADHADTIAERLTALGGTAHGTARQAAANSQLEEFPADATVGPACVAALADRYAAHAANVREWIDATAAVGDADTSDMFTELSREIDKQLWFLEAHLQGDEAATEIEWAASED